MIELDCPGCSHALRIKNRFAGLKGKCRYCDFPFKVPFDIIATPGAGQPVAREEPSPKPMESETPNDKRGSLPFGFEEFQGRPDANQQENEEIIVSSQPGISEMRTNARKDDIPLVDPGADRAIAHRYSKPGNSLSLPLLMSTIIIAGLFGFAFWLMEKDEEHSTFIDTDLKSDRADYKVTTISGIDVPVFGAGEFVEGDFDIPESEPLGSVAKDELIGYTYQIDAEYSVVVSDYQLALTELGWDMVILDSGDETELYGAFQNQDVGLRIKKADSGVKVSFVTRKN